MSGENLVLLKKGSKRDKSIYFIHEGMGEIYTYIKLCESLDYDCWGVPYFMDNSEPTQYYDLDKLVEIYADEIAAHKTNAIISGYSAGGLLAFETARLLEKRGEAVLGAFILDYVPFQMLAEAGEGGEREEKSEPSEEQRNQRLLAVSQKMRKLRNRDSLYEAYQMFTDITDEGLEALFSDILDPEVLKAIPPYHRENLNDY
ncbi:MAG: alpha/beta hydrolase fold domain-containing protein, partial [Oscillospiraceae bacterium]|nr:alpha/beta hydrolase fold domain-containing protein [Oscillospiraceae bacterium]